MEDSGRPLTAKEKRQEQLKRWENSATDVESPMLQNVKPKVKFHDGAVFLAACSSGDLDEVQSLINKGADINFANVDGLTALHQACIDENFEVVEFLVERGAEIDQVDNEGWTPLHAAASCGFMDIANYLVEKGANVAAVNSEGEVPLDIAEDDDMVDFLTEEIENQGFDIEKARNSERESMIADAKQQLNAVRSGNVADVYRHPKSGASALHVAAAKGYIDVIKILLQAGMDVNLRDNDGWTPLHAASHWSQEEAAKLLADKDAEFTLRSKLGQTPFDVADEDMLEYLRELKRDQEKMRAETKKTELIEPPAMPNNSSKVSSVKTITYKDSHTKKTMKIIENHTIESREEIHKSNHEENSISSDSEDVDSTSSSELASSKPHPQIGKEQVSKENSSDPFKLPYSLGRTDTESDSVPRLRQSSSGSNVASTVGLSGRNKTRPASLHISSTQPKETRPHVMSAVEFPTTRPVATTQPIQASKSSSSGPGSTPGTVGERNSDIKEAVPGSWRSGLRKTGSFDDKMRAVQRGASGNNFSKPTDNERSSMMLSEENSIDSSRTARVAPMKDGRVSSKYQTEESADTTERFSFHKSSSSQRGDANKTAANPPMTYKRSVNESSDPFDDETPQASEAATSTSSTLSVGDTRPDRRRSHLQPVRDEEAEAQRKARSRRERQTRRSTQGVTLDVYEEAKKTIETKKKERADNSASAANKKFDSELSTPTSTIPHNDSANLLHQRMGSGSFTSNTGSSRTVNLPSGYIPSDKRVGSTAKTAPLNTSFSIPSINAPDSGSSEPDKQTTEDSSTRSDDRNAMYLRKSSAQQRRQKRKEEQRSASQLSGLAIEAAIDVSGGICPETRPKIGVGLSVDDKAKKRVRKLKKYVRTDESEEPDIGEIDVALSQREEGSVGMPRSPRLSESRKFKLHHLHDKSDRGDRFNKSLSATKQNTACLKTLDDDEEYTALVNRLHQRIRRKEILKAEVEDRKPSDKNLPLDDDKERLQADRVELTEEKGGKEKGGEVKTHKKQPSFVDMFAKPVPVMEEPVAKTETVPTASSSPPAAVSHLVESDIDTSTDSKQQSSNIGENKDSFKMASQPADEFKEDTGDITEKSIIGDPNDSPTFPNGSHDNVGNSNNIIPWQKYLILSSLVVLIGIWMYWLA